MDMGSQDWISAMLRISFVLMYFPEIFFNSWTALSRDHISSLGFPLYIFH